ncbi:MAG: thiamine-phosphate kinase [Pseudomonadales bacterium]
MNEFELIDEIVRILGDVAEGAVIGPGDDGSALRPPAGEVLVSSIDCLVSGVHFPAEAPGELVGYRAMMVSLSDLAAMGATPAQVLVGLTLEESDRQWALDLATGLRAAALATGAKLLGGNLARGPRNITLSVNGFCPEDQLLTRAGASVGDGIFVTGKLGAASAAVAQNRLADLSDPLTERYFRPRARIDVGLLLRDVATSTIDVSDGLLQDMSHICDSSTVGAELQSSAIPVAEGAALEHALHGGDDYELLFTASRKLPDLDTTVYRIGTVVAASGIRLDGKPVSIAGYQHFL